MAANKYISIYLNDHAAALTALRNVAARSQRANRGTDLGDYLAAVVEELETARREVARIMDELGVRRSPFKTAAAWAAEKIGRLKLNGHIVSYSPLSRVLELEGLSAGTDIERRAWAALARLTASDLSPLVHRAERRSEELARRHNDAAAVALGREAS